MTVEALEIPRADPSTWIEGVFYDVCWKCNSWQPSDRPHRCKQESVAETNTITHVLTKLVTAPMLSHSPEPLKRLPGIWPLGLFCIDCNQCYLHPNGAMFCHSTPKLNDAGRPDCSNREAGAWKLFDWKNPPSDNFPGQPRRAGVVGKGVPKAPSLREPHEVLESVLKKLDRPVLYPSTGQSPFCAITQEQEKTENRGHTARSLVRRIR